MIRPLIDYEIRGVHPYHFRSGEWAVIRDLVWVKGRECYLVEFPDGKLDQWPVVDDMVGYEFREPESARV